MKCISPLLKSRRGYALVLVLSFIVLVTAMLVGFLLSATTERAASGGFAASVSARQIADSAVAVVQGQINDATTQGINVAWISQPGMVRTFDDGGALKHAYKLYSAPEMVATSVDATADLPPANWPQEPEIWTDLNAPITANGKANFPILDPAALEDIGAVEGLEDKGLVIDADPYGATDYQPAPMPVRWLYVLKDGQLVAPGALNLGELTITEETDDNPIVGRVAFWTDDDTAKVNINTASEQVFWDTPRAHSTTEVTSYGLMQPARGEYQRYPGHPATVSLSAIFPGLEPEDIYDIIPRITGELDNPNGPGWTSMGGKQIPLKSSWQDSSTGLLTDGNRLFSNVDELMFRAEYASNQRVPNGIISKDLLATREFFLTAHSRSPETNLFNLPRIAAWPIARLVGESTLDLRRTNPFDRLIALCASTGEIETADVRPYFFQREKPLDPANDLLGIPRNMELYRYLQELTGRNIPGIGGGHFQAKYGQDRDQILTQMFDYIRSSNLYDDSLNEQTPPGFPFTAPVAGAKRPVTTGWGNINSTVGGTVGDPGHGLVAPVHGPNDTMGQGRFLQLRQLDIIFIACADPALPESNVAYVLKSDGTPDYTKGNKMLREPFPSGNGVPLEAGEIRVQAMVLPEFFSTGVGWRIVKPDIRIEIEGLDQMTIEGKELQFPEIGHTPFIRELQAISGGGGHNAGGSFIWKGILYRGSNETKAGPRPTTMPMASDGANFPFISAPVTIPKGTKMTMGGVDDGITVRIYADTTDPAGPKLVQTININIPEQDLPVPTINKEPHRWTFFSDGVGTWEYPPGSGTDTGATKGRSSVTNAGNSANSDPLVGKLDDNGRDVARGILPRHADYRLVGAMQTVPVTEYLPHPQYTVASAHGALLFRNTGSGAQIKDNGARLVTNAGDTENGDIPKGLFGAGLYGNPSAPGDLTGDFDNGMGTQAHGAGINKPDEGNIYREPASYSWTDGLSFPYYTNWNRSRADGPTYFSPNRIMPSAGMMGSLPSQVKAGKAWQTLLFRPTATHESSHIGATEPKDHLLLDLFWMPVVEPYAISDRLSTAGKVNMNYQIMPFTYIKRDAGLRAVIKNEKIYRIPTTLSGSALSPGIFSTTKPPDWGALTREYRFPLDVDETLSQFDTRFEQADKDTNVFVSSSEICELHLVPEGESLSSMAGSWMNYRQTGDNMREKPYAVILPKLTTKSNTYTVHFRAQALRKGVASTPGIWREGRDGVIAEYRGSTTIERFINPDAEIPDYAANAASLSSADPLDKFYKWRVIANRQFAP